MAEIKTYTKDGTLSGTAEVSDGIFNIKASEPAIYQSVVAYLANQRQGTASTKNRARVTASGRKLYKQKGTGRARTGSARSPIRVGGGTIFGPGPRSYRQRVPKKVRRLALKSALSLKVQEDKISIIEDIVLSGPKTKIVIGLLNAMGLSERQKVLLLEDMASSELVKSCRNIQGLKLKQADSLCTWDVLQADLVVFTQKGLEKLREILSDERSEMGNSSPSDNREGDGAEDGRE